MEKKLPKVFVNQINKELNNNESVFYSKENRTEPDEKITSTHSKIEGQNINQKINLIFSSPRYVYKADVEIKLKDRTIKKRIVGKNGNYLITIENELIPITDILDIDFIS